MESENWEFLRDWYVVCRIFHGRKNSRKNRNHFFVSKGDVRFCKLSWARCSSRRESKQELNRIRRGFLRSGWRLAPGASQQSAPNCSTASCWSAFPVFLVLLQQQPTSVETSPLFQQKNATCDVHVQLFSRIACRNHNAITVIIDHYSASWKSLQQLCKSLIFRV